MTRFIAGVVLALAFPALAIPMGFSNQDDLFANDLISVKALMFLVPIALLVSALALVIWLGGFRVWLGLRYIVVISWSLVVAVFAFMETGWITDEWKVDAVNRYVASAVPVLDGIKGKSGKYPPALPVSVLGEPPLLLKDFGDYKSDGTSFRFEYENEPAGWAGGPGVLEFDSTDRTWKYDR